ncbi:AaceriAGL267Cp [[Ashbya] aceris (nom. inval.)]|nr:AaceriAGL267Cp [[Ashbya] aceris (nom. inval.)]
MAVLLSKKVIRVALLSSVLLLFLGVISGHHEVQERLPDSVRDMHSSIRGSLSGFKDGLLGFNRGEEAEYLKNQQHIHDAENAEADWWKRLANGEEPHNSTWLRAPAPVQSDGKVRASFVSLVRNSELDDIVSAIKMVEQRFNRKFHYPWLFLNDEPFTDEFKTEISKHVSSKVRFELIPKEHWSYPSWIDQSKAADTREKMKDIIYGASETYRHMCRFESGFFWRHPALDDYDWYWRVEPGTKLYCDIDYDVFHWMQVHDKLYGFTISIHEFESTIPTLWETTRQFVKEHPDYLPKDNMQDFVSNDHGKTYNLCHFWSNFEVASLNFWRSKPYREYFDHLDKAGGFFYERWGDAPVHSIAVSLFLPKDKIHFFNDIGYYHGPFHHCPIETDVFAKGNCDCRQDEDFTFQGYSCGHRYYEVNDMKKPPGYERFQ